jgi:hypothetical protein
VEEQQADFGASRKRSRDGESLQFRFSPYARVCHLCSYNNVQTFSDQKSNQGKPNIPLPLCGH